MQLLEVKMIHGDLQTARAHFFKALGDRTRLDILKMLSENKRFSVTEIYQGLGHAQNLISHHLACLKNCGMVTSEKEGKQVYYRLRNKKILKLIEFTDTYIKDILESILLCEVVADEKTAAGRRRNRKSA